MNNIINKQNIISLGIILILCTSLRNLSNIYYVITGLIMLYLIIDKIDKFIVFKKSILTFNIFIYYTFFVIFISFLYYFLGFATDGNLTENIVHERVFPINGLPRIILLPLLTFILIYSLKDNKDFVKILKIVLFVYLLASFIIILQSFFFGVIEWLGQPSHRGGYRRYNSIIGSITVFGSVVGYSMIIVLLNKQVVSSNLLKVLFFLILSTACIISLSRIGIFIFFFSIILIILYLFIFQFKSSLKLSALIIFVGTCAYFIISNSPELIRFINTAIGLTFGENYMFFSEESKLIKDTKPISYETVFLLRIFYFFNNSLEHFTDPNYTSYGPLLYFTGVGMHGGAGIMGLPGASPHSGLGDLFLMGGPVYVLIFTILFLDVQIFLFKNRAYKFNSILFLCNILFLLNITFVSGALFQPSISIVFWMSIAYIYMQRNLKK